MSAVSILWEHQREGGRERERERGRDEGREGAGVGWPGGGPGGKEREALNACICSVSIVAGRPSENLKQCLRDCGVVPARKSARVANYLWYDPLNGVWEFSFAAWLSLHNSLEEQHKMASKQKMAKLSLAASASLNAPAPLTFAGALDSSTASSFMHNPCVPNWSVTLPFPCRCKSCA